MARNELEAALKRSKNSSPNETSPDGVILLSLSLSLSLHAHVWAHSHSFPHKGSIHLLCTHVVVTWESCILTAPGTHLLFLQLHKYFTIVIIIILIKISIFIIHSSPRKWIQLQLLLERRKWSYCCKNWREIWRKHAMKRRKHCNNWPVSNSICWKRLLLLKLPFLIVISHGFFTLLLWSVADFCLFFKFNSTVLICCTIKFSLP